MVYIDNTGVLDYLVVRVSEGSISQVQEVKVSCYWLEDCLDAGELLDVQYHHHPLVVPEETNLLSPACQVTMGRRGSTSTSW